MCLGDQLWIKTEKVQAEQMWSASGGSGQRPLTTVRSKATRYREVADPADDFLDVIFIPIDLDVIAQVLDPTAVRFG
jgi:hypothetical protein